MPTAPLPRPSSSPVYQRPSSTNHALQSLWKSIQPLAINLPIIAVTLFVPGRPGVEAVQPASCEDEDSSASHDPVITDPPASYLSLPHRPHYHLTLKYCRLGTEWDAN
ncbi:hypothetical protein M758_1G130400 [Ceratodon purpureus]|uniref:Uncharacterized protein n=1 Tax=Ceratodon purpureus TaxID=3225 RepID=A0A8T0J7T6_CERPU|nr:hypothetical protein KC19_1G135600 [Ceratodon purpureus]KAG0629789.1 hypothetical protein M758_1G130400 [Ceratodon purpureus]